MEHGQGVEHFVGAVTGNAGERLRAVGQQIAMREHDALRRAFRAGREQDGGGRVGIDFDLWLAASKHAFDFVGKGDRGADVFEIDDLGGLRNGFDQDFKMALFDEDARGEDDLDLGGLAGSGNILCASREVQHGGDAANRLQREEGHRHANGVWQHHADVGFHRR